jgi:hypothetical protein
MPHSDESLERVPAPYDPELSRLANALAGLEPRVRPFDRDALMFRAGQASIPQSGWTWPLAASVSSFLAVVFGATLVLRATLATPVANAPVPALTPRPYLVPVQPAEPPAATEEDTLWTPYNRPAEPPLPRQAQIQEQLLRWGLDGLPAAPPAPARPRPESLDMILRSF